VVFRKCEKIHEKDYITPMQYFANSRIHVSLTQNACAHIEKVSF